MSDFNQEFKLRKINDHGRAQKRTLQLRYDKIVAMNRGKPKRAIRYEDISGITFNIESRTPEFILHNPTGDLRYKWKDEFQRKIILMHFLDHATASYNKELKKKFYCVKLEDLKPYQNTKIDYEQDHTIRMPNEAECNLQYFANTSKTIECKRSNKPERQATKPKRSPIDESSSESFQYVGDSSDEDATKFMVNKKNTQIDEFAGDSEDSHIFVPVIDQDNRHRSSAFNKFTS